MDVAGSERAASVGAAPVAPLLSREGAQSCAHILRDLGAAVRGAAVLEDAVGSLCSAIASKVRAERVALVRLTARGTLRPLRHAHGVTDDTLARVGETPINPQGRRGIERVITDGVSARVRVDALEGLDAADRIAVQLVARRDLCIVRWEDAETVLGVLAAYDSIRQGGFTEDDVAVLEVCASGTALMWRHLRALAAAGGDPVVEAELRASDRDEPPLPGLSRDATIALDDQGRIVEISDAAVALFGYPRDRALGVELVELIVRPDLRAHHHTEFRRLVTSTPPTDRFHRVHLEAVRADGDSIEVEIALVQSAHSGDRAVTAFIRDVSQVRRLALLEREQAARIRALEAAKTHLLNVASHELRGPITTMSGYVDMLADGTLGPMPDHAAAVLPLLQRRVAEMNLVVDGMLEAARLEDGRLGLTSAPVDLRTAVATAVERVVSTTGEGSRIRVLVPAVAVIVEGDGARLSQLLGNLLSNALKFSPVSRPVHIRLDVQPDRGLAAIEVEDSGLGIADGDLPALFTRFGRIVTPENSHIQGTGLGLYLAQELARMHGGDIGVTSVVGQGSLFRVTLPLAL